MTRSSILQHYARELERLRAEEARLTGHFNRLAVARGMVFIALVVLLWLGAIRGTPSLRWALGATVLFAGLMVWHERIVRLRDRGRRRIAWYERGMARLEDRWAGGGQQGDLYRSEDHLFADDLDLFGTGSLFELLCTAETPTGRETLADWLKRPAPAVVIAERQAAVAELKDRSELRVDLAVIGSRVGSGIFRDVLMQWGAAPAAGIPVWLAPAGLLLALLNVFTLIAATWWGLTAWAPTLSFLASVVVSTMARARVRAIVAGVERPLRDLDHMAGMIERLEQESWSSPLLQRIGAELRTGDEPASRALARLDRLAGLLDTRRNQLFAPVGALLLWTTQLALAVERWRVRHGPFLGRWVTALGEVEALASIATYTAEHPECVQPELVEGPARLQAEELAHPLLPVRTAVPNDVTLSAAGVRAWIVSGSNMSGKSTLLRAVGVNVVLAQAGAPVSARRLVLSPLAIGASFRPQDSLQHGQSRFYAEIGRLRRTVDLLQGDRPVLFLLDEMLSGTNSYDRALGARAIVEHLVTNGAIGLVTTHDLALAEIADAMGPLMANVHFEDHLEAGQLRFDYRLRPGVVRRSNAVELMRSVGLPV
jgi:hypothetical protein